MAFLETLLILASVVLLGWGVWYVARRPSRTRVRRQPLPPGAVEPSAPPPEAAKGWTRQDKLALASLVIGSLLGIVAIFK